MVAGHVRARKAWGKLPEEDRIAFQTTAGEVPGAGQIGDLRTTLDIGDARQSAKALSLMNRTTAGRAAQSVAKLEALAHFDRWKAGVIRRAVAAEHIHKLNREVNGFASGIHKLWRTEEQMFKELKGKSLDQQIQWINKHPKAQEHLAQYVDDVMGNWTALTRYEQNMAPFPVSYTHLTLPTNREV